MPLGVVALTTTMFLPLTGNVERRVWEGDAVDTNNELRRTLEGNDVGVGDDVDIDVDVDVEIKILDENGDEEELDVESRKLLLPDFAAVGLRGRLEEGFGTGSMLLKLKVFVWESNSGEETWSSSDATESGKMLTDWSQARLVRSSSPPVLDPSPLQFPELEAAISAKMKLKVLEVQSHEIHFRWNFLKVQN